MPLNTVEEIYAFLGLTTEDVQPSVVGVALDSASGVITAFSPEDDSARSDRMEPIRKLAEKYFAGSEVFLHFANIFFMSQPPIRLLNVLSFGAGADSPTPTELLSSLQRTAELYREQGFYWLARAKPITSVIRAGSA